MLFLCLVCATFPHKNIFFIYLMVFHANINPNVIATMAAISDWWVETEWFANKYLFLSFQIASANYAAVVLVSNLHLRFHFHRTIFTFTFLHVCILILQTASGSSAVNSKRNQNKYRRTCSPTPSLSHSFYFKASHNLRAKIRLI
jgi:hypothetical protein